MESTIKSLIYLVSFIFLIRFVHPNDCSCLIDSIDSMRIAANELQHWHGTTTTAAAANENEWEAAQLCAVCCHFIGTHSMVNRTS